MNLPVHSGVWRSTPVQCGFPVAGNLVSGKLKEPEAVRRFRALRRVDGELSKGNYKGALGLVKQLQGKPGGLQGFGAAKQMLKAPISPMAELELNGMDISPSLESLVDAILDTIRRSIIPPQRRDHEVSPLDLKRTSKHEAGHFLVGYLLGFLPRGYEIVRNEARICSNGKVTFEGFDFLRQVEDAHFLRLPGGKMFDSANGTKGRISFTTLKRFMCVILGGIVAECLVFGRSFVHRSDIEKLNRVLKWFGYTEDEAERQVRWAAMNTVVILASQQEAQSRLAEAMESGKSVGSCIDIIETSFVRNGI